MSAQDPVMFNQTLESLKQAVAMLEESAARQAAERNAQASGTSSEALQLGRAMMVLRNVLQQEAQSRPEVRESLELLSTWFGGVARLASGAKIELAAAPETETSAPLPVFEPVVPAVPMQPVPLMIAGVQTVLHVPGTAEEVQAARDSSQRVRNEGWTVTSGSPIGAPMAPVDMTLVALRCRLKAEGCDWAAQYRERYEIEVADGGLRKMRYNDIISRAKAQPNCYVWALNPKLIIPGTDVMARFAQGYRNLATAAEMADSMHRSGPHGGTWLSESYAMLADAQSAIRVGLEAEGLYPDADQEEVFRWLRNRTSEDRILVSRSMRLDDPADLADADGLATRLEDLRVRLSAVRQQASGRKAMLSKARYHAKLLHDRKSGDEAADWRKLLDALGAVIESGVPPSDVDIRDVLALVIDVMPDDLELPKGLDRAMEVLDALLTTRELEGAEEPRLRAPSPELAEVAELLRDRVVVLIGGECRPRSKRALEQALGLAELRWVSAGHHQSHYLFESAVARPETVLVMVAIRWSSHSFENVDELCRKHGKLYVRLPGGYNANQVAKQILDQVGDQLRRTRPTSEMLRSPR